MGINRSAALVVGYLIAGIPRMSLLEAVELTKNARGVILGNTSFCKQLLTLARRTGQLDSTEVRSRWIERADALPPRVLVTKPRPPDDWISRLPNTVPEVGKRCYVQTGGAYEQGHIVSCDGEFAGVLLDNGDFDRVQCYTRDLIVSPGDDSTTSAGRGGGAK